MHKVDKNSDSKSWKWESGSMKPNKPYKPMKWAKAGILDGTMPKYAKEGYS